MKTPKSLPLAIHQMITPDDEIVIEDMIDDMAFDLGDVSIDLEIVDDFQVEEVLHDEIPLFAENELQLKDDFTSALDDIQHAHLDVFAEMDQLTSVEMMVDDSLLNDGSFLSPSTPADDLSVDVAFDSLPLNEEILDEITEGLIGDHLEIQKGDSQELFQLQKTLRDRDSTIQRLHREVSLLQLANEEQGRFLVRIRELEKECAALRDVEATKVQVVRRMQEECDVLRDIETTQQETIERLYDERNEYRKESKRLRVILEQRQKGETPKQAQLELQIDRLNTQISFMRDELTQRASTAEAKHQHIREVLSNEVELLRRQKQSTQDGILKLQRNFQKQLRSLVEGS